jgi:hypothetical protein
LAGNALVTAAVTDAWERVRHKIARIIGRGRPDQQIEKTFDATRAALEAEITQKGASNGISYKKGSTVIPVVFGHSWEGSGRIASGTPTPRQLAAR